MIVLDIETTGLDPRKNCMLSLGAVDYDSGAEFYGECSLYKLSEVTDIAMSINGFKLEDVITGEKQPAHKLYWDFLDWSYQFPDKLLGGHNLGHLDILFLEEYHTYLPEGTKWPFGYRTLDLHSVAFTVLNKSLSHEGICEALGLPKEAKPHNALGGARSERDAFKELFRRLRNEPPVVQRAQANGGLFFRQGMTMPGQH